LGLGDELGLQTLKAFEQRLPKLLGADNVEKLVSAVETKAVADVDLLLDKHVQRIADEADRLAGKHVGTFVEQADRILAESLAGAQEVALKVEKQAATDLNRLLETNIAGLKTETEALLARAVVDAGKESRAVAEDLAKHADRRLEKAKQELETLLRKDLNDAVDQAANRAERMVKVSLGEASATAERLIAQLSQAVEKQRTEVRVDLGAVAGDVRREALKLLPWVALLVTALNTAALLVGWGLFGRH